MRRIGCIPTQKFVADAQLVKDIRYALKELQSSVLMYPEAGYSFDGTALTLPESLGKCIKLLKVPVVMIRTQGAVLRDPLYNNLQLRKVKVKATMEYLLSPEDIKEKTAAEINEIIGKEFSFDEFRWQQENQVPVREKFRADCLNRVLYKCPDCLSEGHMEGKGTRLTCNHCGHSYELTEYGKLQVIHGESKFEHIPDWFRWERECVRKEIAAGTYAMEVPVDIYMLVNTKCLYHVGSGELKHSEKGFSLTGCDGKLVYEQKPTVSYTMNADYYWYEMGDIISIGNHRGLFYCFPKTGRDVVTKTKLAAEELYKMKKNS